MEVNADELALLPSLHQAMLKTSIPLFQVHFTFLISILIMSFYYVIDLQCVMRWSWKVGAGGSGGEWCSYRAEV